MDINLDNEDGISILDSLIKANIVSNDFSNVEYQCDAMKKVYPTERPIESISLEIANDCNLACKYCYGDCGAYGGIRQIMSLEKAIEGIDFLIKNSGEIKKLKVCFFGGEPLMNFKVMKEVVKYCREKEKEIGKEFLFSMTTNATLLNDEINQFIIENKVSVMVSLDGSKNINDEYRVFPNGSGSFDLIESKVKELLKHKNLVARATVCSPNLKLSEIGESIKSIGFKNIHLSLVNTRENSDLYVNKEDIKTLNKELEVIAKNLVEYEKINKNSNVKYPIAIFDDILASLFHNRIRVHSCGAARGSVAITSEGNIYPCHRFSNFDGYKLGDCRSGIDPMKAEEFRTLSVDDKEDCKSCWARYLCGGGCHHTCALYYGSIKKAPKNYCDFYKKIIELSLYIYWKLKQNNEEIFKQRYETN